MRIGHETRRLRLTQAELSHLAYCHRFFVDVIDHCTRDASARGTKMAARTVVEEKQIAIGQQCRRMLAESPSEIRLDGITCGFIAELYGFVVGREARIYGGEELV